MGSQRTIRPFETMKDFEECVRFQEETWGQRFSERVSVAILKVSQRLGGIAAGAYDDEGGLAGFVFGITGVQAGEVVHWSDMLAVRPESRDAGLGFQLKAYQRETLLEIGVTRVYWTFDPLESKNAHLNLNKLGAVAGEYVKDMYGQTDSPLHRGIGTDRLVPTWSLDSNRVIKRMLEGRSGPEPGADADATRVFEMKKEGELDLPGEPDLTLEAPRLLVPVPTSIQLIQNVSLDAAAHWRRVTRSALSTYLDRGYEARELYRRSVGSEYLLSL